MDDYAQALRKLFKKAYSTVLRGEPEADSMGRTVLANQFVSGLQTELKSKVVGTEGNLEQLLVIQKARFEEAKRRELAANIEPFSPSRSQQGTPAGSCKEASWDQYHAQYHRDVYQD